MNETNETPMTKTKPPYHSLTIWAAFAMIVHGIGMFFGVVIDAATLAQSLGEIAQALLSLSAGIGAAWGRYRATTRIG